MPAAQLKPTIPALAWLFNDRCDKISGDVVAGLIVALMLVPQVMACALLAGLPREAGPSAGILPLLSYGFSATAVCSPWGRKNIPRHRRSDAQTQVRIDQNLNHEILTTGG